MENIDLNKFGEETDELHDRFRSTFLKSQEKDGTTLDKWEDNIKDSNILLDRLLDNPFSYSYYSSITLFLNLINPLKKKEILGIIIGYAKKLYQQFFSPISMQKKETQKNFTIKPLTQKALESFFLLFPTNISKEIIANINSEFSINLKNIRTDISKKLNVNESTVNYHISKLFNSSLIHKYDNKSIIFSREGIILLNELIVFQEELLKNHNEETSFQIMNDLISLLDNKIRIYIILSLSMNDSTDNSFGYSDLLSTVNIIYFLSSLGANLELIDSNILSYHLNNLKQNEIIKKEIKNYELTELGQVTYRFLNLVLIRYVKHINLKPNPIALKKLKAFHLKTEFQIILVTDIRKENLFLLKQNTVKILFKFEEQLGILNQNSWRKLKILINTIQNEHFLLTQIHTLIKESIILIPPLDIEDRLYKALVLMEKYNINYLPVRYKNNIKGLIDIDELFLDDSNLIDDFIPDIASDNIYVTKQGEIKCKHCGLVLAERASDNVEQEINIFDTCPECRGDTTLIQESGEIICANCGLVISGSAIDVTHGGMRAYSKQEKDKKERTGCPISILLPDVGLSTIIDRTKIKNPDLRRAAKWNTHLSWEKRNMLIAITELKRIGGNLNFPERVKKSAVRLYKEMFKKNLLRGRSINGMIAACAYYVCKQEKVPITLQDILDEASISDNMVKKCYKILIKELNLTSPPLDPIILIPRYCTKLGLSTEIEKLAVRILTSYKKNSSISGIDPKGLCAGAIYLIKEIENLTISKKEILDVIGVSKLTLEARYMDLLRYVNLS